MDQAERARLAAAWTALCREAESAGQRMLADPGLPDLDAVEGLRHVSRLLRMQLGLEVESWSTDFPMFNPSSNATQKRGYECPDYAWQWTHVRPDRDYRIVGYVKDSEMVSCTSSALGTGEVVTFTPAPIGTGMIETPALKVDADGRFEVIASMTERPGNWLPMKANTDRIGIRSVVGDRRWDSPALVTIEPVGGPEVAPALTAAGLAESLEATTALFATWAARAADFSQVQRASGTNVFTGPDAHAAKGGTYAPQTYQYCWWELGADEAMVIDAVLPECRRWNFHLCNYWAESLDFVRDRANLNNGNAEIGDDRRLRIVLAPRNPGHANWMNTAGRERGTMVFRYLHSTTPQQPEVRVVPLAELQSLLAAEG